MPVQSAYSVSLLMAGEPFRSRYAAICPKIQGGGAASTALRMTPEVTRCNPRLPFVDICLTGQRACVERVITGRQSLRTFQPPVAISHIGPRAFAESVTAAAINAPQDKKLIDNGESLT